jgi:hypothetical protein
MAYELLKRSGVDALVIIVGIIIGMLGGAVLVGLATEARGWISWLAGILFSMIAVWAIQSIRLKLRRRRQNGGSG